jgi:phosphatidylglycerophosphate synthase
MNNDLKKTRFKAQLQKIKTKEAQQREKIKKLIIRHKDDFLTALEKNWRDWILQPLTKIFNLLNIRANYITYAGCILIAIAIWLYFKDYEIKWQLLILALAGISDIIDGPTARNNNDVTILGTWLDHIRDGFFVIWTSYFIYQHQLLSLELILIIWILQIILVWITLKDFLIRYLQGLPNEEEEKLIHKFSMDNLQASIIGRLQFSCWGLGYLFLALSLLIPNPMLVTIGQSLIILEIIFGGLNILESYQKTL